MYLSYLSMNEDEDENIIENIIDRFMQMTCWFLNKWEDYTQLVWKSKPHRVRCIICGATMSSKLEKYSPVQAGWVELAWPRRGTWICHSCSGHHDEHYKMIKPTH